MRGLFRRAADHAADYRESVGERRVGASEGFAEVLAGFLRPLGSAGRPAVEVVDELVRIADSGLVSSTGPRYFGFVVGGALPAATAAEMLAAGWDQNAWNSALSPTSAAAEQAAGDWLKELLGLPANASAGFVTGAQAANTVALAAARNHVLAQVGWDVEANGLNGAPKVRILAGDERHATIDRSLRLLGFGTNSLELVRTKANGVIDLDDLRARLAGNQDPLIVCLQAGNVNTGATDALTEACQIVRHHSIPAAPHLASAGGTATVDGDTSSAATAGHAADADAAATTGTAADAGNAATAGHAADADAAATTGSAADAGGAAAGRRAGWVHVDGAFGLWAAVGAGVRDQVAGVELADSWGCDGHKWLNLPYDSGFVFTAHPESHYAALALTASYMVDSGEREPGDYAMESSRRARGLAVWAGLQELGRDGVSAVVDRCCALARRFAGQLEAAGCEIGNEVVLNQVLVSFGSDAETDRVIAAVQDEGVCWMGGTTWRNRRYMRISVSNHLTTESDVDRSIQSILTAHSA
ncbi:aspartate aminotransferase family protein [Kribbella qitaiheensis]|uniref:Aspartate aminotransferase family protein n=1 Tax=Kribbella qitaiheensis TaxID=1544730 RepID=A0A7G6XA66_9ACTN|nr:aspartate aminotransferase family protein [Kribbella qitaiheensis]